MAAASAAVNGFRKTRLLVLMRRKAQMVGQQKQIGSGEENAASSQLRARRWLSLAEL
jgi:hypothetical protein